jgi:hypothetical protein
MSLKNKMHELATKAAQEGALRERARCLWCAEQVVARVEAKLENKLLMSAVEEQGRQIKMHIARAVVSELRRAIVSGIRPPAGPGEGGAADLSDPLTEE